MRDRGDMALHFSHMKFILSAAFLLLLTLGLCPAQADEAADSGLSGVVARIDLRVDGAAADRKSNLEDLSRNLIRLKEKQPFTVQKLEESIRVLKGTGLFRTIDIPDPVKTPSGLHLTFVLTAYYRIRDIRIFGAFPLLERELLTAMTIYTGDAFIPVSLRAQVGRIKDLYRKEGYPEPDVSVTADLGSPEQGVVVTVRIVKGRFYYVKKCIIQGNKSFFSLRLKLRTHFFKASFLMGESRRLIQEKLDEDVANLIRFYRGRGYPDVQIKAETEILEKKKKANVRINITEGPYYIIRFKGNKEFWDYTLKKDLDFSARGNVGDITLKRGMRSIRERYRKAGYPDAWVTMNSVIEKKRARDIRTITITVDEGYRSVVGSLAFEGNHALSEGELGDEVLSKPPGMFDSGVFVPEILNEDISALKTLYSSKGYAHAKIKDSVTWEKDRASRLNKASVTLHVDEDERTIIRSVNFHGLSGLNHGDAFQLLSLKEGQVYSEEQRQGDEKKLSAAISEKGYPHVTVSSKTRYTDDKKSVDIVFHVNEGPFVETGKIVYQGNFITKEKILEKEVGFKEGDYFSLMKYLESQRNMRDINALNSVEFQEFGLKSKKEQVDLLVSVEEKKPYYFQAAAGYDTTRNRYMNAKLGDRNLFGLNKDAWISQEISDIGYRTETGVTEQRFLGTRISSTLNLYSEKLEELNKDTGTITYGSSLNLSRDFARYFTAALSFTYEFKDQYQRDSDALTESEEDAYDGRHMFVTSPSISYNSTDSFIRPRKGIYSSISVEYSNALGDAPDDFLKYHFQARYYYSPLSFLTFALRARYGYLNPIAVNSDIPDDQLFYLGGATDVRGFDENMLRFDAEGDPMGGREFFTGSVEARIDLGLNFELTCFYDSGRIKKTNTSEGSEGMRSSMGTGLRYVTPIGPVGFLYGWKVSPKEQESSGNLHFTIGYSF